MKNHAPLVSIIVNNYNYAPYLRQAIESSLEQSYSRTEVLVIDDGSTDDSRKIISEFGERIMAVFKENEGQASTFNVGFEKSRGAVVVFLDADDLLMPRAVERAVTLFDSDEVVKVHWPLLEIDAEGNSLGKIHRESLVAGNFRDEFIRHGPINLPQSPTSGNAWARWFLQRVMPLPEHEDKHGADGFLKKSCPIFGEIRRVAEPQGYYRIHPSSYGGGRGSMFKMRRGLNRYPTYCRWLAKHLHEQGVEIDPASWMGPHSQYAWLKNAATLQDELAAMIPEGEKVILIDDNCLGEGFLPNREVLPFVARGGVYWGPPSDDQQAIEELRRTAATGSRFVVLAFPAFWWLSEFPELVQFIRENSDCLCENDRSIVFELQKASGQVGFLPPFASRHDFR